MRQKAMQSAAKYNAAFNKERREERRAYFDIHTFVSMVFYVFDMCYRQPV